MAEEQGPQFTTSVNPLYSTPHANFREVEAESPRLSRTTTEGSLRESFTPRRSLQSVVVENFAHSLRGVENFHVYLWILKDFAWAQDDYWLAVVFGSAALVFCGVLMYLALWDLEEVYMYIAMTLWLFGNYWWMAGEVGIHGDDDTNSPECAHILSAALCWMALYYLCLRPLGIVVPSSKTLSRYKHSGLKPRFNYFLTWRQYEHTHTLFWMAKDLCWNLLLPIPWAIFSVPTVLIACDFVYVTWKNGHIVDSAHYCAQLIWVISNLTWAAGEIFVPQYDDPIPITTRTPTALKTCRWWASVLLVCAFVPITSLYFIYFPIKTCEQEGARRARTFSLNFTTNSDDDLLDEEENGCASVENSPIPSPAPSAASNGSLPKGAAERSGGASRIRNLSATSSAT